MKSYINNLICVTNRKLCNGDFFIRLENIAKHKPKAILLREKDLSFDEYESLAKDVLKICTAHNVQCIIHSFIEVALKLNADSIHLTLNDLKNISVNVKHQFKYIGSSCHSVEDSILAQSLDCTYIVAGHIFETLSKKNLAPRGIDFLNLVVNSVSIPVYAIGGINQDNINQIFNANASGACIMSGLMQCESVDDYFNVW